MVSRVYLQVISFFFLLTICPTYLIFVVLSDKHSTTTKLSFFNIPWCNFFIIFNRSFLWFILIFINFSFCVYSNLLTFVTQNAFLLNLTIFHKMFAFNALPKSAFIFFLCPLLYWLSFPNPFSLKRLSNDSEANAFRFAPSFVSVGSFLRTFCRSFGSSPIASNPDWMLTGFVAAILLSVEFKRLGNKSLRGGPLVFNFQVFRTFRHAPFIERKQDTSKGCMRCVLLGARKISECSLVHTPLLFSEKDG